MYQSGTLANRTKVYYLRNPSLILRQTQLLLDALLVDSSVRLTALPCF